MNNPTRDELLRQIRDRLTFICVALFVVVLIVLVPELYKVNAGLRVAALAGPLAVAWYVRWLRELNSVKPPTPGETRTAP